jgi:hypothetical protein
VGRKEGLLHFRLSWNQHSNALLVSLLRSAEASSIGPPKNATERSYFTSFRADVRKRFPILTKSSMLFAEGKAVAEEEDEENEGGEGGDEGEEEESDMELAWKMLETARLIHEKQPGHTVEEADVITTLADISTERGRMRPLHGVLGRFV